MIHGIKNVLRKRAVSSVRLSSHAALLCKVVLGGYCIDDELLQSKLMLTTRNKKKATTMFEIPGYRVVRVLGAV